MFRYAWSILNCFNLGLANDARQKLIDRQVNAVQSVADSEEYLTFRTKELTRHTTDLRNMIGPLLNIDADRSLAGRDLGFLSVAAWELGVKMFTSHCQFQIYFPETAGKFNAATMVAKDSVTDPLQLQICQTRLKLIITPVVTMRDDRGSSIKVKNLHHSTVLTMD